VSTADEDLVACFDGMGRLRRTSVDRNATCVAEFLGQGATPGETAGFKEQIETHAEARSRRQGQEAGAEDFFLPTAPAVCSWFYGLGKIPSNLPFFFSGFSPAVDEPLFSAVFSGASFNSGPTAAR
jgi:hypothetical protein